MTEKDIQPTNIPLTLKSLIHATRMRLTAEDVVLLGHAGAISVLEELFTQLTKLINSKGNVEQKKEAEKVIDEYDNTKQEMVYSEVSTQNYATLYKLTIEHRQDTYQEATESTVAAKELAMEKITLRAFKSKRMEQCQKLEEIAKNLTDADEDVGSQFKSSRDII